MKILHIVPTYFPATRYGGPIQSVHDLNKGLIGLGHQVTVFTTNVDGDKDLLVPVGKPQFLDGVEVWYFPAIFRPWFYSSAMRRALIEKTKEFDLVHITSVFLAVSTLGAHYARKFNKPYIISPRGSLMVKPLKKSGLKKKIYLNLIERRNLSGASAIHFTTELEKAEYLAAKLPLKDFVAVPNFLEPVNKFPEKGVFKTKLGLRPEDKIILSLGRLNWKKGFDTLIPAFAEVVKIISAAKLIIVGGDEGGYKENIQILISKFQLKDKVIFTGELRGEEKLLAYQDAEIFVLPSYAENFAMTVLEAAQCGLPSVVTPAVGLAEEIKKFGAGLVVEKTPTAFAAAIKDLLGDESTR
ncbi:MAG: glycosyltransferase, partial [Candidatus Shapirobacteria bacterium]